MVLPKVYENSEVWYPSLVVNYTDIISPAAIDTFGVKTNSYNVVAPTYFNIGVTAKVVCWYGYTQTRVYWCYSSVFAELYDFIIR